MPARATSASSIHGVHARLDDLERRDPRGQIEQHAIEQVVVAAEEAQRAVRRLAPGFSTACARPL